MFRLLFTCVAMLGLASPALAQAPKLGATTKVEITENTPADRVGWRYLEFVYPIEQGDKFRIQVEPVGGAAMKLFWVVHKKNGAEWGWHEGTGGGAAAGKIDATVSKGLPGKTAKVLIFSDSVGALNVRITKVGDDATDEKDAKIKKLEEENATLKKELAEMKAQLADIKKLLEKKQ